MMASLIASDTSRSCLAGIPAHWVPAVTRFPRETTAPKPEACLIVDHNFSNHGCSWCNKDIIADDRANTLV